MTNLFNNTYSGKNVLVTGHTGFKGSWLIFWLEKLGANILGYSLDPASVLNHYSLLRTEVKTVTGDIRDFKKLDSTFKNFNPDIVFHLAAQPLVLESYKNPITTYEINVMGTLNIFEVCKKNKINAIVNVTSDKAYENKEWIWGYREEDSMGGHDPYSSSKGCSEILTNSYRNSYFNPNQYNLTHKTLLASCRAGNVIGGGDWAENRLIPDIMKSVSKNETVNIRNPYATRPWQHVLEPLSGYLTIGEKLLQEEVKYSGAWNFGPSENQVYDVKSVVTKIQKYWNQVNFKINDNSDKPHEASLLKLDCSKANQILSWRSIWGYEKTFEKTIEWYKNYYNNSKVSTENDLIDYVKDAKSKKITWAY